jgi:hypothetical protein
LEGYLLELVVLALVVIYVMGQPSIQKGHLGPATIQSSYNDIARLTWPNRFKTFHIQTSYKRGDVQRVLDTNFNQAYCSLKQLR